MTTPAPTTAIEGWVAPGFEKVRDTWAAAVDVGDGGAAFAAFHRGRPVVDLWCGRAGGEPWQEATRGCWMSVTKLMTTICMQVLVDRGLLDVDAPVADHWPEFAAAGKERITVRQVLTHSSGTVGSPELAAAISLDDGTGFDDHERLASLIAEAPPAWEPGTRVGYQAITFGPLLGELVRRVTGRTLGTFFRDEVALPLGVDDVRIGTPVDEHHLIAPMHHIDFPAAMPPEARAYWEAVLAGARVPGTPAGLSCQGNGEISTLDRLPEVFDSVPGRVGELGGSNLVGPARGVARILAAVVESDGIDGVRPVSQASLDDFSTVQRDDVDEVLLIPIARATGWWRNIPMAPERPRGFGPNDATLGHTGLGGQIGFADPVARVGAAMVRSHHTAFPLSALLLHQALYDCIDELDD